MNLYISALLAGALMCLTAPAFAHDMMHSHMASMDTNGDGMISKDEFMNHMQAKWDKLPKNKDGMVMMKDMEMMHHDKMMKHHEMMKDDKMKDMNGGG